MIIVPGLENHHPYSSSDAFPDEKSIKERLMKRLGLYLNPPVNDSNFHSPDSNYNTNHYHSKEHLSFPLLDLSYP